MSEVDLTVNVWIEHADETIAQLSSVKQTCDDVEASSAKGFSAIRTGASRSQGDLYGVTRDAEVMLHTVTALDHTWTSWERAAKQFDILSFTRAVLATINLVQALTRALRVAQAEEVTLGAIQTATSTGRVAGISSSISGFFGGAGALGGLGGIGLSSMLGIGAVAGASFLLYQNIATVMEQNRQLAEIEKERREAERARDAILQEILRSTRGGNADLFRADYRGEAPGG